VLGSDYPIDSIKVSSYIRIYDDVGDSIANIDIGLCLRETLIDTTEPFKALVGLACIPFIEELLVDSLDLNIVAEFECYLQDIDSANPFILIDTFVHRVYAFTNE